MQNDEYRMLLKVLHSSASQKYQLLELNLIDNNLLVAGMLELNYNILESRIYEMITLR